LKRRKDAMDYNGDSISESELFHAEEEVHQEEDLEKDDNFMGLPRVAGRRCEISNQKLEHQLKYYIQYEQSKILPDNGLISVLCNAVRLCREYSDEMNKAGE
jgi:hypothetical protein